MNARYAAESIPRQWRTKLEEHYQDMTQEIRKTNMDVKSPWK